MSRRSANKRLTGRALDADGVVHGRRAASPGAEIMCPRLYTACHALMFCTREYTCRKPTSCLLCLVDDGYPHAIVTEEYEPL